MLPWDRIIFLKKKSDLPVYLQISNAIISAIKGGLLKPGGRMPGTRAMSELLKVHRKTIVASYDELTAQGWIYSHSTKGTFVNTQLPEINPKKFVALTPGGNSRQTTGYSIKSNLTIKPSTYISRNVPSFFEGPDVRLIPVAQLAKAYKSVLGRKTAMYSMSYVDGSGNAELKTVLSEYLNDSRGLQTTEENIFISRGSQMALYMLSCLLIKKGDIVIVGNPDYYYANYTFIYAGANLMRVPVDADGLDVDQIEQKCKKHKIRAIYVTSHHHYPTTVTLCASRRMKLLKLAEEYGFVIIEDDYDYDFHYESGPILPLASADKKGMVVYIGTLSKTVAPALRIGYVVAPMILIFELSRLRQIIDTQGDPILEKSVAELFREGEIRRHMKKALKEYHTRRDFMCAMLKEKLGDVINFKVPDGGLSIWANYDKKIVLPELSQKLKRKGVTLSNGLIHDISGKKWNSNLMGFGPMNTSEAEKAITILHDTIKS
jgi:GntR family transcriptional regulator/MocR family aminotransferase